MARRSSATRKARREKMMTAEHEAKKDVNRSFEMIAQDIKVIDIKRKVIKRTTRNLPFAYVGVAIAGILLAGAVLAISVLGIFLTIALLTGALAQITGPTGALTLRKKAHTDIDLAIDRVIVALPQLPAGESVAVFGVKGATKTGVHLSHPPVKLSREMINGIDGNGVFALGDYKHVGVAKQLADGQLDLSFRDLVAHTWYLEAREKGLSEEAILDALQSENSSS